MEKVEQQFEIDKITRYAPFAMYMKVLGSAIRSRARCRRHNRQSKPADLNKPEAFEFLVYWKGYEEKDGFNPSWEPFNESDPSM